VDKAPDAFRTISEVADDLDVPQHVLRFWETRFPQIRPMKRGGGRRYYRPDDVELLRGIRHLLYGEGYTIRGVQGQIKEKGLKFVQGIWKQEAPPAAPSSSVEAGQKGAPPSVQAAEPDADARQEAPNGHEIAEPSARVTVGLVPAARPAAESASPAATVPAPVVPAGLGAEDRERLAAALSELNECRRLLDAVLKDTD
jgi:DNA-binding transcriptional MerR regulator